MGFDHSKDPDHSWEPYAWKPFQKFNWGVPNQKMEVPDYRIYDKIDGIPELEHVRETLAARGLKDPWIRNEVWRYPPTFERNLNKVFKKFLIDYGMKYGFLAAVGVISVQHLYYNYRYGGLPPHVTTLWDWLHKKTRYPRHI